VVPGGDRQDRVCRTPKRQGQPRLRPWVAEIRDNAGAGAGGFLAAAMILGRDERYVGAAAEARRIRKSTHFVLVRVFAQSGEIADAGSRAEQRKKGTAGAAEGGMAMDGMSGRERRERERGSARTRGVGRSWPWPRGRAGTVTIVGPGSAGARGGPRLFHRACRMVAERGAPDRELGEPDGSEELEQRARRKNEIEFHRALFGSRVGEHVADLTALSPSFLSQLTACHRHVLSLEFVDIDDLRHMGSESEGSRWKIGDGRSEFGIRAYRNVAPDQSGVRQAK